MSHRELRDRLLRCAGCAYAPLMGTRLVFSDGERIASELELEDVETRMAEGRVIPASRKGSAS